MTEPPSPLTMLFSRHTSAPGKLVRSTATGFFAAVRESGTGTEEPISRTARGSAY